MDFDNLIYRHYPHGEALSKVPAERQHGLPSSPTPVSSRFALFAAATLLAMILSGCGGGGSGSNMRADLAPEEPPLTEETPLPPSSQTPSSPPSGQPRSSPTSSNSDYGSYGDWIQGVQMMIAAPSCTDGCTPDLSDVETSTMEEGPPFESPFGSTAEFNPGTEPGKDNWEATWRGGISGVRSTPPYLENLSPDTTVGPQWSGEAVLEIRSVDPGKVYFWTEMANYETVPDNVYSPYPDQIPTADFRWVGTLSTDPGKKGYFSGNGTVADSAYAPHSDDDNHPLTAGGTPFAGQFSSEMDGTAPASAIGHIQGRGHIATFSVDQE